MEIDELYLAILFLQLRRSSWNFYLRLRRPTVVEEYNGHTHNNFRRRRYPEYHSIQSLLRHIQYRPIHLS
jgi:hypothetical protein